MTKSTKAACSCAELLKALQFIAAIPLWGEPIADDVLRVEYIESHEYDAECNHFNPSADTECNHLQEAVGTARRTLAGLRTPPCGSSGKS